MTAKIKLLLALALFCELALVQAKVHHENHLRKRSTFQDTHKSILNRERRLVKWKRAAEEQAGSFPLDDLHATQFDLKNGTHHNQALIHWSGNNSKVIFVLTRKKEASNSGRITNSMLWRSTDYGESYTQEDAKMDSDTVLNSYYTCPSDAKKALFVDNFNNSGRIWVTRDEGETYNPYLISFTCTHIEFHPTQPDWLLGYNSFTKNLYVSQNLGINWKLLHRQVTKERYFWGNKGFEGKDENEKLIVHLEYRNLDLLPRRRFFGKSCYIPDCKTTPFQKVYDKLGYIDEESLNVQQDFIFAQKPSSLQKLYTSYKREEFRKGRFQGTAVEQEDFHIISSDGGTVVVGVSHGDHTCHLFFSDQRGEKFKMSKGNVRFFMKKVQDEMVVSVDAYEVKGVRGVFIMNILDENDNNVTVISHDNGRNWDKLNLPKNNNENSPYCDGCSLNLHVIKTQTSSGYFAPSIVSKESVPGLIIAHGTVSQTVEEMPTRFHVFVSRDAGKSWEDVFTKRHLFNIADHGAMIVGVQMMFLSPVKRIHFSNNYGASWTSHSFSKKETINVDGLLTEPGEYTHHFTLFGHKNFHDSWKLYALDFSSLVKRNCTYPDDYENVTMPISNEGKSSIEQVCTLGMIQTVEMMKKDAGCMIGTEYKRYTHVQECKCKRKDYECAFEYTKEGDKCVPIKRIDNVGEDWIVPTEEPQCVNGYKTVETGFVKIPGDKCVKEMKEMIPRNISCDGKQQEDDWSLHVLNDTYSARVGESIMFQVQGVTVTWKATNMENENYKVQEVEEGRVQFSPPKPGRYFVSASGRQQKNSVVVEFWYPIEKATIFAPPLVQVNEDFTVYGKIQGKYGVGDSSNLGPTTFEWLHTGASAPVLNEGGYIASNTSHHSYKHAQIGTFNIQMTASNQVSKIAKDAHVDVLECVHKVELEVKGKDTDLESYDNSEFNSQWWIDFEQIFHANIQMLYSEELSKLEMQTKYDVYENSHVFVPPVFPLKPQLLFTSKAGLISCDQLEQISMAYSKLLSSPICMTLGGLNGDIHMCTTSNYQAEKESSVSGGIIFLIIMIVVAVFLVGLILYKRNGGSIDCSPVTYLMVPRAHGNNIVRNHGDRDPIVDSVDEFIDDEFQDGRGTLEFTTVG